MRLLRQADIARMLGVRPSTVAGWVKKGYLRPVVEEDGRIRLFSTADVERMRIYWEIKRQAMARRLGDETPAGS